MAVTATSSSKVILDEWNGRLTVAKTLLKGIGKSNERSAQIAAIERVKVIAQGLLEIHGIAYKKSELEDKCYCFSRRKVLNYGGWILDAAVQAVTTVFLADSVNSIGSTSTSAYIAGASIIASMAVAKAKQYFEESNVELIESMGKYDEILMSRDEIENIEAQIKFWETSLAKCSGAATHKVKAKRTGITFREAAEKVIISQRQGELREKYVTVICKWLRTLNEESVAELTETFRQYRDLIYRQVEQIKGIRDSDKQGDISIVISELEFSIEPLRELFSDVDQIIRFRGEIEKSKGKRVAINTRHALVFLLSIASLVSLIIEVLSSNSGITASSARFAALVVYVIMMVLSWGNTLISKREEKHAKIFQALTRLKGQSGLVVLVDGMIQREGAHKPPELIASPQATVLTRSPDIGVPGSPIQVKVDELTAAQQPGYKKFLRSPPQQKGARAPSLTIEELALPASVKMCIGRGVPLSVPSSRCFCIEP